MLFALCVLAILGLTAAQQTPLQALGDSRGNQVWSDFGSVARYEISVFEANLPSSKWKVLGHHAQGDWEGLKRPIHAFRESANSKENAFAVPANFTQVWNCQGDTTWQKGSFWRMECPAGFVALGDVVYAKNDLTDAPKELFEKFRCVKESLTESCIGYGIKVWDNDNSIARKDASVWPVQPESTGFSEFFFANTKFNERPSSDPVCLKKSAFTVL